VFYPVGAGFLSNSLQLSSLPDLVLLGGHSGLQNKGGDFRSVLFHACCDYLAASPEIHVQSATE
jgi:hypothetical protein